MNTEPPSSNDEPAWFVGFEWGSEKHRTSLFDRGGKLIGRRDLGHSAAAYAELGDWLLCATQAQPGEIAVAIETTHGPAVDALIDRGFRIFAINSKQLDRFRDRYNTAGAKDDTRDTGTLGRSLRTDRVRHAGEVMRVTREAHPVRGRGFNVAYGRGPRWTVARRIALDRIV